jgi:hypothetical protein
MQILSLEDVDFPPLKDAFSKADRVGSYMRDGKVQLVRATSQFVIVANGAVPTKLAIKPVRSLEEALQYGKRIIEREEARGATTSTE